MEESPKNFGYEGDKEHCEDDELIKEFSNKNSKLPKVEYNDWYDNKKLYEMISSLRDEMRECFKNIEIKLKEHNNFAEKIDDNCAKIDNYGERIYKVEKNIFEDKGKKQEKQQIKEQSYKNKTLIISTLGWGVAFLMLLLRAGVF